MSVLLSPCLAAPCVPSPWSWRRSSSPSREPFGSSEAPSSLARIVDDVLIETMRQSEELGYAGRYEMLDPVLRQAFNFPYMARVSVGRYWRDLKQRAKT